MFPLPRVFWSALGLSLVVAALHAQPSLPGEPIALGSLEAFRSPAANWKIAGALTGDPRRERTLAGSPGSGVVINTPSAEAHGHLFTSWEHGDLELDLEFLLPPGSNSGVYLQGRYEVQLLDSWNVRTPTAGDCGAIYQRWDDARGKGNEGYEGHAPRANACRAPGLWQQLHIEFQAPRFDASGKKTRNARFAKIVLNGFTIHENVEVTGPTRSAEFNNEAPLGPLMIQGDHGPVALRHLAVRRFDAEPIRVADLHYRLFAGDFKSPRDYDNATPKSEGVPERFAHTAVEKSGKFALVFTGQLIVSRTGDFAFSAETSGLAALTIDGQRVIVPLDRGSQPGTVALGAGPHAFRLDFIQASNGRPALDLIAAGPGLASQSLMRENRDARPGGFRARQLLVDVKDRVVLQRGFVPFEPRKRLYAASIGTPAGVHYAYDFETGAVLRAWRGNFVDAFEMWDGRGNNQLAKPAGPALTFNGKPAIALIEFAQNGDWPDEPEKLWASQGYTLEPDGQPVFNSTLADLTIRDRIAAAEGGRGLARTIECKGKLPDWSAWLLLAEAGTITAQPGGRGWVIGEREWYLDWPADAAVAAVVRTANGRQQLAVPLTRANLEKPIQYEIVW